MIDMPDGVVPPGETARQRLVNTDHRAGFGHLKPPFDRRSVGIVVRGKCGNHRISTTARSKWIVTGAGRIRTTMATCQDVESGEIVISQVSTTFGSGWSFSAGASLLLQRLADRP